MDTVQKFGAKALALYMDLRLPAWTINNFNTIASTDDRTFTGGSRLDGTPDIVELQRTAVSEPRQKRCRHAFLACCTASVTVHGVCTIWLVYVEPVTISLCLQAKWTSDKGAGGTPL